MILDTASTLAIDPAETKLRVIRNVMRKVSRLPKILQLIALQIERVWESRIRMNIWPRGWGETRWLAGTPARSHMAQARPSAASRAMIISAAASDVIAQVSTAMSGFAGRS